jgi:hypothetical protein
LVHSHRKRGSSVWHDDLASTIVCIMAISYSSSLSKALLCFHRPGPWIFRCPDSSVAIFGSSVTYICWMGANANTSLPMSRSTWSWTQHARPDNHFLSACNTRLFCRYKETDCFKGIAAQI